MFLAYVNVIRRNTASNIRLFGDDCIAYRKIMDSRDIDKLLMCLNRLGKWAVENELKINPGKNKAVSFTKARLNERIWYYLWDQLIPKVNSFKYLGIIIRNHLNFADHVSYTLIKARKAFHFIMRIIKRGNNNTKRLAYTALVRAVCWDPYREGQVSALNRVQKREAKFANNTKEQGWNTLAPCRMIIRICALFKAYT